MPAKRDDEQPGRHYARRTSAPSSIRDSPEQLSLVWLPSFLPACLPAAGLTHCVVVVVVVVVGGRSKMLTSLQCTRGTVGHALWLSRAERAWRAKQAALLRFTLPAGQPQSICWRRCQPGWRMREHPLLLCVLRALGFTSVAVHPGPSMQRPFMRHQSGPFGSSLWQLPMTLPTQRSISRWLTAQ